MIPMAPLPSGPPSPSKADAAAPEPGSGFDAALAGAMQTAAPEAETLCVDCAEGQMVDVDITDAKELDVDADIVLALGTAPTPSQTPLAATGSSPAPVAAVGTEACTGCGAAPAADTSAAPVGPPPPSPIATRPVTTEPLQTMAAPTNPTAAAVQPSAPADAVATSSQFVDRVERVVAQLELAGPPKMMVVDLAELGGMRVTVSLRGAAVHVAFSAAVPEDVTGWMAELQRSLAGRGLQLTGDAPTSWDGDRKGSQHPEDPNGETPPEQPQWKWPPDLSHVDEGGIHGSDLGTH